MSDSNPSQSDGDFGWTADFDSVDIPDPVTFGAFDDVTGNTISKPSEVKVDDSEESTSPIQVNVVPDEFDKIDSNQCVEIVKTKRAIGVLEIKKGEECASCEEESDLKESLKVSSREESNVKIESNVLSVKEINCIFNCAFSIGEHSSFSPCDPCSSIDVNVSKCNVSECDVLESNVPSRASVSELSSKSSSQYCDDEWKSLVNVLSNALSNDPVWRNLETMEGAQSVIKIKWNLTSHSFHTFLHSLNVDPNHIVRDDVPIFASGLGSVLEPVKKAACDNSTAPKVGSLAPKVDSSLEQILTPQPLSTTVLEVTCSSTNPVKPNPVDRSVTWFNGLQSVDWNQPQAEVSRCSIPVPLSSFPTDVPFHPVSNARNPASSDVQCHNSSSDTIIVTVNPIGVESGSNGDSSITNNCDEEWIGQSIKSKQQQFDTEEIGGGFDRVLIPPSCILKDKDECPLTKNDQCPPTVHHVSPFHTSGSSSSSSLSTPNNDSLPILAFLSTHLQP